MPTQSAARGAGATLFLSTLLHGFTHAYASMLVPLYLLIKADLHLDGVQKAAAIVTVYGVVYCSLSFPSGMLADRMSRKIILGIGLLLNAAVIVAMGLTHSYAMLIGLAILAGIAGTAFHPSANALVTEHFPKSPGMAIGMLGIGSGLGFFGGPQFAGWRAQGASWHWNGISDWQRPCIELGLAGLVLGVLFLIFAREARTTSSHAPSAEHPPLGKALRGRVALIAFILSCRDFAGTASLSLTSIYLQKTMKLDAGRTGLILGAMMLMGVIANPLAVYLSPGARRLPALVCVLVLGGFAIASAPLFETPNSVLPILCMFQALQFGSYAISDSAMLERVPANVRGRVVGLFLMIAGTFAGFSPWAMGVWTDLLGPRGYERTGYFGPYGALGVMMILASASAPAIARLGKPLEPRVSPMEEIMPATLEAVG